MHRHDLVYDVAGAGPPMLLIHGLASARTIWEPIRTELNRDYTTVAVDLPGHGESPWLQPAPAEVTPAELAELLRPLVEELEPVHLVGHSMGGWIGLEMASNGWGASLTALCPAGLEFDPWVTRSDIVVMRRRISQLLGPAMPPLTQAVAKVPFIRDVLLADATADFDEFDTTVLGPAARAMGQARGFYPCHDGMLNVLYTRAEEVPESIPVSIIWGTQDGLLPAERQRRVAGPSHARWIVFDQCAHAPMWDQPEKTIEVIRETAE